MLYCRHIQPTADIIQQIFYHPFLHIFHLPPHTPALSPRKPETQHNKGIKYIVHSVTIITHMRAQKHTGYFAPSSQWYIKLPVTWRIKHTSITPLFLSFFCRMSVSRRCLCCVKYLMFVFNLIFWVSICTSQSQVGVIFVYLFTFPQKLIWDFSVASTDLAFLRIITLLLWWIKWLSFNTGLTLHFLKARRMRFVWCWSVAVLHTGRVFLSSPVLPIPLSCQSAASRWWHYHGDWLPGLPWSP